MPGFYPTPELRAKRKKMRLELAVLRIKAKLYGKLSEADRQRLKEIMVEFAKHY